MRTWKLLGVTTALALLAACDSAPLSPPAADVPVEPEQLSLERVFTQAGAEFGVPADLLKAVSYVETRWQMVEGEEEFPGWEPAFGVMALRGERLVRGAELAGVSPDAVRTDVTANVRAAAALLAADAAELGIQRADLGAWAPVVARYSGIPDEGAQAAYVHREVYAALREGAVATRGGEAVVSMLPTRVNPDFREPDATVQSYDYGPAVWRPSPNYNYRPSGTPGTIHMVIIHTCEGSYTSCWSWLTNSAAKASAHYVVNESGSEISQLVREAHRAWHIAATYDCSRNGGHACYLNGYGSNDFTIGIEHGGYASQSSFPAGQIDASAKLSCDISKAHNIPRDRYHYVAHGQLQPWNRTDPGPNWPWSTYMNKINSYCGAGTIIIDSNNNNNNGSVAKFETTGTWSSSSSTAGYYGTGYAYASTKPVSEPATFWFYLPSAATKTIDAWWTAGSNRSASAPFIAFNASGTRLGTVYANQQANGGKWNALGTWNFSAGWNKVVLSKWTTEGYVVIADAVRVR